MKLDELGFVGRGKSKHRPRNDPSLYGGEYPFVQTGDVKEADLWLSHYTQTYNEAGLAQSKLWPAGTLCITIAANIAETAILKIPACFPDSIVAFIPDEGKADARFVKYYIDTIKLRMQNASKGTTQDNLSVDKLLSFDFDLPDYPSQERIASVLCTYDDLIENNNRRVKILEEMAQMIYREWFVNFRFPGYKIIKLVKTQHGSNPEHWRIKPLRELTTLISRGISPAYDENAPCIVINQKCIRNSRLSLDESRRQSKVVPSEKLVKLGDILINSTGVGTLGRVAQVLEPMPNCTVDSHVSIVRPKSNMEFLGKALLHIEEHFAQLGVGSTGQTELGRERIANTLMTVPPEKLQEQFGKIIEPINRMLVCCFRQNANLKRTRDLLLPKLISGEVSVEHPEPEAASQIS